jgi:predicted Zn-dependent peptidase
MERLTEYDEFGNAEFVGVDNTKLYERLVCDETVALTIATNKLAEFEDFMEEQGFESLEEIKRQCDLVVDVLAMDSENHQLKLAKTKLGDENQALKDRWQKLKSHIEKERNTNSNISLSCSDCMYSNAEMFCEELLEKIQELEKEIKC